MKAILLASFVLAIESAGEPCSTVGHLPVINICMKETAFDDVSNTILLKSDKKQNCTCELSLSDQNHSNTINLQRFENLISSNPSNYNCGLMLMFSVEQDIFGEANCFGVIMVSKPIEKKDVITISSITINGTLQDNEGYCIEIKKADAIAGHKLKLTCGIGSYLTTITTTTETTTSLTKTRSLLPFKTTTPKINLANITINSDELTFATGTSNDGIVSTKHVNPYEVDKGNDDTVMYVALVTLACGFVIVTALFILCCKRFQMCVHNKSLESNTVYEQAHIPSAENGTDETSIGNNYSSLSMRDVQSPSQNERLCGTNDIPLSIISRGESYIIKTVENERQIPDTNRQSYQYANLLF